MVLLNVGGMTCEHCVARVQAALEAVEGVESAEVSLAAETANVVGSASAESLIEAVEDMGKSASLAAAGGTGSVRLRIGGMMCEHCVSRVRSALEGVEGVASAEVVLADEMATVVGSASAATLIEAVEDMGKSASLADAGAAPGAEGGSGRVLLRIGGMTCEHCVARVQKALESVDGVERAEVVLADETATVTGSASAAALIEAVEGVGKSASLLEDSDRGSEGSAGRVLLRIGGMTCFHTCQAKLN